MDKKLVIASVVKEELKARSGLKTISSEAVDWVNDQVSGILDLCVATGRRTPGGRLMAPPAATPAVPPPVAESPAVPEAPAAEPEAPAPDPIL